MRVLTTSTSFMIGTGLKKCKPTNRSVREVAMAISVIVNDDVLLAKIADSFTSSSRAAKVLDFSSMFSTIASMIKSQSAS